MKTTPSGYENDPLLRLFLLGHPVHEMHTDSRQEAKLW